MEFIKYNTTGAQVYTRSTVVKRVENCNGFIAVNTGDSIVTVNDRVLYPGVPGTSLGDSVTIGGNLGEIYLGQIKIVFAAGGLQPEITIEQKFYIVNQKVII